MKKVIHSLLAATLTLSVVGCTPAQLAQVQQLADKYLATVALQTTDENGNAKQLTAADIAGVELDGQPVDARFTPDGELQLPEGDYARDRSVRVRLKDGQIVDMTLNRQDGHAEGRRLRFAGDLHRRGGRLIGADVLPGGNVPEQQRIAQLKRHHVVIRINRPGLAGRLRQNGIDRHRLPQNFLTVTPQGDMLVNREMLRRFAKPGSKLWAVVAVGPQAGGPHYPGMPRRQALARANRHVLFVLKLNKLPALPQPPAPPAPGSDSVVVAAPPVQEEIVLNEGTDVTIVTDETTEVPDPETFAGVDDGNNGHGNDADGVDESNPGHGQPSPEPTAAPVSDAEATASA